MSLAAPESSHRQRKQLSSGYQVDRIPAQKAFHASEAFIRGYGGAMGGGKTRAMCEEVFRLCMMYPGLVAVLARQAHTSIIGTTKKTFMRQVLPQDCIEDIRETEKKSGGEDWIKLRNGSMVHFIGLDDPVRWFSSEIGFVGFDEAQEIAEDDASLLISRLRQRCDQCVFKGIEDCAHMPNRAVFTFNPDNPGHWLRRWFMLDGAAETDHGFYKEELWLPEAEEPLGDCEFFLALPVDNPFLSKKYVAQLRGMRGPMRERLYEGKWNFVAGKCYFSEEALTEYGKETRKPVTGISEIHEGRTRIRPKKGGPWAIWKRPVREHIKNNKIVPAHRYVVAVDVSSGGSQDYSGIQVIDVENFEQVARFQGKADPDLIAVEAARIGKIYNEALIAAEVTGGWGYSIVKELQRLRYRRLYTRRVWDRLSDKWTDKVGWDTTVKSRAIMLDTLERVIREREFGLYDSLTIGELGTFVRDDLGRPAAQPGCNDDLVMSLGIGVYVVTQLPRQLRKVKEPEHVPQFATGW